MWWHHSTFFERYSFAWIDKPRILIQTFKHRVTDNMFLGQLPVCDCTDIIRFDINFSNMILLSENVLLSWDLSILLSTLRIKYSIKLHIFLFKTIWCNALYFHAPKMKSWLFYWYIILCNAAFWNMCVTWYIDVGYHLNTKYQVLRRDRCVSFY